MIKNKYILIVVLCLCFKQQFSQQKNNEFKKLRDSLQTLPNYDTASFFNIIKQLTQIATKQNSPQKKADVLHIIGTYFYFRTEINKANLYYDSALSILKKYPDRQLKNSIELKRGYLLLDKGEFNKAKLFYLEKELSEKNDTMAQILINMALGQIYQAQLKYDSSLTHIYKSVKFAEQKKDLYYIATTKNNLGALYQNLSKNSEAEKEFIEAVAIATKLKNKKLAASINSNVASIYIKENKIKEALGIYNQNLIFYSNTHFYYEISYMYLNISFCYSKLNDESNMILACKKTVETITKSNLPIETINIYSQISSLYHSKKMYKELISLSNSALLFSQQQHVPILEPQFYNNLSDAYEAIGDNDNALKMKKKYITFKDSIDKISNDKLVNELVFKHQLTEKEQKIVAQQIENKLLKKENELYNLNTKYYSIILVMVVILLVLLGFFLIERRIKKQKEVYAGQLINEIDKDRERIAMDLHDDLGLEITITRQKYMNADFNNAETFKEIDKNLLSLLEKTRKISRDLFPSTLKHLRFIEFVGNLLDNTEKQTGIICSYEIEDVVDVFNLETKTHILRILQECIQNSIKHSSATAIKIEINKMPLKKIQITYLDNGVGFKETKKEKGLGLKNIYQRASLINAETNFTTNDNIKGMKLILTLAYA